MCCNFCNAWVGHKAKPAWGHLLYNNNFSILYAYMSLARSMLIYRKNLFRNNGLMLNCLHSFLTGRNYRKYFFREAFGVSAEIVQKILVVDDEADTRIFLLNLLNASGFNAITANNKADGFKKAVAERPSVIILNMMMPGKNGIHLYQQLKQDEILRQIPVIMLSNLDKDTFLRCHNLYGYRKCEASGSMDAFMEKPLETEDLLTTVQDLSARGHG